MLRMCFLICRKSGSSSGRARECFNTPPVGGVSVEMMGFLGMGNNPMVGATVAVAVAVDEALNK